MNYIEIIFENISKEHLDKIIGETLKFDVDFVISSHFFDEISNQDMEFKDIKSLLNYFKHSGTGNIFLEKAEIGIVLEKVLIIISCDEELGDITINFSEEQFIGYENTRLSNEIMKLIQILCKLSKSYSIDNIFIGYEPATDDDMKMIEFNRGSMKIYNQKIFQSSFAKTLYNSSFTAMLMTTCHRL